VRAVPLARTRFAEFGNIQAARIWQRIGIGPYAHMRSPRSCRPSFSRILNNSGIRRGTHQNPYSFNSATVVTTIWFGTYSVVALLYEQLPAEEQAQSGVEWEGKATVTFSDAITIVRRWLWTKWVIGTGEHAETFAKLPESMRQVLMHALAPAA
jgi:hypothetical protein